MERPPRTLGSTLLAVLSVVRTLTSVALGLWACAALTGPWLERFAFHTRACTPARVDLEYGLTLVVGLAPWAALVGMILALRLRIFVKPHTRVGLVLNGMALVVTLALWRGVVYLPSMPCMRD